MNTQMKRKDLYISSRNAAGMALLDILLAIVVFAVGMLALAHLQGNLSRSSSDANSRTAVANVAEELVEQLRTYQSLGLAPDDTCPTDLDQIVAKRVYACLSDSNGGTITGSVARGDIDYAVTMEVNDWYFLNDRETLTDDKSHADLAGRELSLPDFKRVELTVSWDGGEFLRGDGTTSTGRLGTGSFSKSVLIPSVPVFGGAKIAAEDDGAYGTPPVEYTRGLLPDVIPVALLDQDGEKFKESETPMPDVVRSDYIVETWFDVITYSANGGGDEYLRREEFAVVACECTLQDSANGGGDGFLPTTWSGVEYNTDEGKWVSKQFGVSANNQQSQYCDTCCRDHHDKPNNSNPDTLYRPRTNTTHSHYVQSNQGAWSVATAGDDYLEVCRMVRKDGFMRVAQDFDLNGMVATRQAHFIDTTNVGNYSTHVTDAVTSHYGAGNTSFGDMTLPGDATGSAVPLPRADLAEFDQQVSRALYTDHITTELASAINCLKTKDASCAPPGVTTELELLPFYEIQTTWLSFWRDNVEGKPVIVSNDTIADDNSHSRGLAELKYADAVTVRTDTYIHPGNNGLTATDPIDGDYDNQLFYRDLFIDANGGGAVVGGSGPASNPHGIFGSMSGSGGIKASDATFTPTVDGVYCNYDANSFECVYDGESVTTGSITITGYRPANKDVWVCDTSGQLTIGNDYLTGTATIELFPQVGEQKLTGIYLSFQTSDC